MSTGTDTAPLSDPHSYTARNSAAIVSYLNKGNLRCKQGSIGLELEHQIVRKMTHAPVSYYGKDGIEEILEDLSGAYSERTMSEGHLIGLAREDSNITLEPAAQLEISISPQCSLAVIQSIYEEFRSRLDEVCDRHDAEVLTRGYHPTANVADLTLIPKERYRLMDEHFAHTGTRGICMMRGSASTQVSIDYSGEKDCVRKFRVANLLGPLIYFITDNTPVFENELAQRRMIREYIWSDVDAERSMVVPGAVSKPDYGFADYASYLLGSHPILVEEDGTTVATGDKTAAQVYADREMTTPETEHLMSMFFPDVRLKHYVEIRMADSLPIEYALAYAAFIKGIFYHEQSLAAVEEMLPATPTEQTVPDAKAALVRDSWLADVYGKPVWQWFDELLALAWAGLEPDERPYLEPLATLIERRTTLFDEAFRRDDDLEMVELEREYVERFRELEGDAPGRQAAVDYIAGSTGFYHGEPVKFTYIPKLLPPTALTALARAAETTHRIICKVTDRYIADESYRELFGFSPELEKLVCLDSGIDQHLPYCRLDIFLNEDAPIDETGDIDFKFCEFNTNGASAMNEDRECAHALMRGELYRSMAQRYEIVPQTLFDPLVRSLMAMYARFADAKQHPHVGIVDFTESASTPEFEVFRDRFARHGISCEIYDIRTLAYDGRALRGSDGRQLDCIFQRTVTYEIMDRADECRALIDAARDGNVCLVGGFDTQVGHTKKIFEALHDERTAAFLEESENEFIRKHVPYTAQLDSPAVNLDEVLGNKDRWILKPIDGYGSRDACPGYDHTQESWEEAVAQRLHAGYIVQEYCPQYYSPHTPAPIDDRDPALLEPYSNMPGLFVYDGKFAGVYTRAGNQVVIVGTRGGLTSAGFIVHGKHRV